MVTWSAIACAEEHNTATEGADLENGISASVTLRCAYANRWALVDSMLGVTLWPYAGGANAPVATTATIRPMAGTYVADGQACVYTDSLVTVNFSNNVKDLLSESLEPTAEFLTLDYKRFRWSAPQGDPILEGEAPGRQLRGLNLVRTMYRRPSVPAECLTRVGYVNQATYTSALLGLSFPAETMLFNPPNTSRSIKTDGTEGWTITTKFSVKPQGWNKYWRMKTNSWERMYLLNGGIYYAYPLGDFSNLLV